MWYARQVANYPCYVIFIVLFGAVLFTVLSVTKNGLPNFKDPLLGFESRGTDLSKRTTAWHNLLKSTSWDGPLTFYPGSIVTDISNDTIEAAQWRKQSKNGNSSETEKSAGPWLEFETDEENYGSLHEDEESEDSGRIIFERPTPNIKISQIPVIEKKNFFCNNPTRDYAHVIIQSPSGANLFSAESLKSMCDLDENKLRSSEYFSELCEQTSVRSCCRSWSIANYVALLSNLSTCHTIEQSDVNAVLEILTSCASYYHNMKLSHDCAMNPALCRGVPRHCIEYDAVYNILHYLTDINFLNNQNLTPKLTYAAIFLPIAQSSAALNYYEDLIDLRTDVVEVVGMEFGLKYRLFAITLQSDTILVGLAGVLIFLFLWIYSSSFFVTFMTFCGVVFSMATAYFMYSLVYQIKFFPFINLLTIIIIIGINLSLFETF